MFCRSRSRRNNLLQKYERCSDVGFRLWALGSRLWAVSRVTAVTGQEPKAKSLEPVSFLLYLRPRVPERHRPVEHELAGRRVGIDAEVSDPFELEARAGAGAREARLDFRVANHVERQRVDVLQKIVRLRRILQ